MIVTAFIVSTALLTPNATYVPENFLPPELIVDPCTDFDADIRLCGLPAHWAAQQPHSQAAAEYSRTDGFFAQVVLDMAGTDQGLTLEAAADAILSQMQSNPSIDGFELLMRGKNSNSLNQSVIMVYRLKFQGISFIYANTIYVGHSKSVQLVTWRVSQQLEAEDRDAHLDFGSGLALMPSF